jgi:hypothetical protein
MKAMRPNFPVFSTFVAAFVAIIAGRHVVVVDVVLAAAAAAATPPPSSHAAARRRPTEEEDDASSSPRPTTVVVVYEAENASRDPSSVVDVVHHPRRSSGGSYVDMGGIGSWLEFVIVEAAARGAVAKSDDDDHRDDRGYDCAVSFRYSNGASNREPRACVASANGSDVASLRFPTTGSWGAWSDEVVSHVVDCAPGTVIRLTAASRHGGPNVDAMTLAYLVGGGGGGSGSGTGRAAVATTTTTTNEMMVGLVADDPTDDDEGDQSSPTTSSSSDDPPPSPTISSSSPSSSESGVDATANPPPPRISSSSSSADEGVVDATTLSTNPPLPPPTEESDRGDDCDDDDDVSRPRYNKFPDGMVTYGYDDGGCFFCGGDDPIDGSRVHPSKRGDLVEMCRRMCDSDHGCVAYTIGRGATREGQEHKYDGTMANCCLERRLYPPGAYVDGSGNDARGKSNCQLDAACWTRYERGGARGGGGVEVPSSSSSSSWSSSSSSSSSS